MSGGLLHRAAFIRLRIVAYTFHPSRDSKCAYFLNELHRPPFHEAFLSKVAEKAALVMIIIRKNTIIILNNLNIKVSRCFFSFSTVFM